MQHRTFGKRVVNPPAYAYGQTPVRADTMAVWDGVQQAGLDPDTQASEGLTPERARAMEDAATAQLDALVGKVNAHIPGVTVIPWAIIPGSVWEGPNAELLISTDFMPSSPWNNMLLPADPQSAEFLGLPEHPRTAIHGLHENLSGLIDQLRDERRDQIEACKAALPRAGWSAIEQFETYKNDRFQKLFALARHVSGSVFGDAVCARHDELFGIGLSEVTG